MFDIGFWEVTLLFALGLMILGPERLPRLARSAGLWMGRARAAARKLQREVERELLIEETRRTVEEARRIGEARIGDEPRREDKPADD